MYYHYTTLDTFLAILQGINYKAKEPVLQLHATRIDKVNDPTEMTIDKKTFLSIVQHYEDMNPNIDTSSYISKSIENIDDEKFRKILDTEKSNHLPYIICLSEKEDYLPMWSLYGDKGRGVCLGFSKLEILVKSSQFQYKHPSSTIISDNVCYGNYEKSNAILSAIGLNYPKIDEEDIEDTIANMYLGASPFLKHPGYEYENEYRICVFNFVKNELGTIYDSQKTFIDYDMPISFLKTVTLGAKLCSSIISELLSNYFSKHGLQIEIQKSQIPFR